jgi:hypothetical protein
MKKHSRDAEDLAKRLDKILAAIEKSSDRRQKKSVDPAMVLQVFAEELAKIEDAALLKSIGIASLEDEDTR